MHHRRTHTRQLAAARAGIGPSTGARLDADPRLPSQRQLPRGRRRPDPLAAIWDAEIIPMLQSTPGLRPIAVYNEMLRRHPDPARRQLSLPGAHILAGQLREAVGRRQALAASRVGQSRACPFNLHALVPVPAEVLQWGPDYPAALAFLWRHWGTTQPLRHVPDVTAAARRPDGGSPGWQLTFWSADWTPWRAIKRTRADWPDLRVAVRPQYDQVG